MRPHRRSVRRGLAAVLATGLVLPATAGQASSTNHIPPEVDPGTPTYSGLDDPVPDEPAAFDPTTSMLRAIHDADVAAGGDSFWIDRILQRPAGGSGGDELYTRGRALYMYTHDEDDLGFGGGWAYRERPARARTCTRSASPTRPSPNRRVTARSTRAIGPASTTRAT